MKQKIISNEKTFLMVGNGLIFLDFLHNSPLDGRKSGIPFPSQAEWQTYKEKMGAKSWMPIKFSFNGLY